MPSSVDVAGVEFFPARADIVVPPGVLGPQALSFDVNAFVVRRGTGVVLVDTLLRPDHGELIREALERAAASFSDITCVVLTHHHPDHTGGLAEIARRAPQAQVLCGAADAESIRRTTGVSPDPVESGDVILGMEVIATPGHTPGHLCLFDHASSTMLLADIAGNNGRLVRAPARFTENPAQAETTMRALAERDFETALPSHGNPVPTRAALSLRRLAGDRSAPPGHPAN